MQIIRGKLPGALKVVLYGPEGIGKSTFAACFPAPLFIDTEDSTKHMDVARVPRPLSWPALLAVVDEVIRDSAVCGTLVLDTADWAEIMCARYVCDKAQKSGIEDFGYGKGYVYLSEEFGRLLNKLSDVVGRGVHVVLTAHAKMRKFEQPDEMGAYDRWEMKLSKLVAPMVKEWADMVLFANYKTFAVKTEDGKVKAQGGERRMFTTHHPCWDAKNRHGLAPELPLSFEGLAPLFAAPPEKKTPDEPIAVKTAAETPKEGKATLPAAPQADVSEDFVAEIPEGTPPALAELMRASEVTATDIQMAVSAKGYFPLGMPITEYPPDFVDGCLIGAWEQVYQVILEERKKTPF